MGKSATGVTKEILAAKSHCQSGKKMLLQLSLDLHNGSLCPKAETKCQKIMPGEFLLLGAGSIPSGGWLYLFVCLLSFFDSSKHCHPGNDARAEPLMAFQCIWCRSDSRDRLVLSKFSDILLLLDGDIFFHEDYWSPYFSLVAFMKRMHFRLVVWETSSFFHHFLHSVQKGSNVLIKLSPFFCKEDS